MAKSRISIDNPKPSWWKSWIPVKSCEKTSIHKIAQHSVPGKSLHVNPFFEEWLSLSVFQARYLSVRELSILKPGYRVEEFLEGAKFFVSFYWVIKYSGKIAKYLMGCEIFGMYFRPIWKSLILQRQLHLLLLYSSGREEVTWNG